MKRCFLQKIHLSDSSHNPGSIRRQDVMYKITTGKEKSQPNSSGFTNSELEHSYYEAQVQVSGQSMHKAQPCYLSAAGDGLQECDAPATPAFALAIDGRRDPMAAAWQ